MGIAVQNNRVSILNNMATADSATFAATVTVIIQPMSSSMPTSSPKPDLRFVLNRDL
jgi:hypothetical protein